LNLKIKIKRDEQYLVDLDKIKPTGSDAVNYDRAIVVNRIACGDARD
jgi:hypothetical protein